MYLFSTHTLITPKFNFVSTKLKGTMFFFSTILNSYKARKKMIRTAQRDFVKHLHNYVS